MKVWNCLLIGGIAILPLGAMAESFLSEANVTYRGDDTARAVCRAVVEDDADSLEDQLKKVRRESRYAYRYYATSDAIVRSVTCNDMELQTFADSIGASNISGYLGGGQVTIEEVVVIGRR